jgi:hypothetical protein
LRLSIGSKEKAQGIRNSQTSLRKITHNYKCKFHSDQVNQLLIPHVCESTFTPSKLKIQKMKATTIVIAAVLAFGAEFLFTGKNGTSSTIYDEAAFCPTCALVPVTPTEANFDEINDPVTFSLDFLFLAPATPEKADFSDFAAEINFDLTILAPVTPAEADFSENTEDQVLDVRTLAPVTPKEADFEY